MVKLLGYPKVKDIMQRNVVKVDGENSIIEVCKIMGEKHIGSVIVEIEGKPTGIFTERDLLSKIFLSKLDIEKVKVKDYMSKPLVTIKPDVGLREAARMMSELHIRRLPVVDDEGRLLGIITSSDIVSAIAKYGLEF